MANSDQLPYSRSAGLRAVSAARAEEIPKSGGLTLLGAGAVPKGPEPAAPAAVPERSPLGIGPNNEFTRNVANAMNAVPGVNGVARGAGVISRAVNTAVPTAVAAVRGAELQQAGGATTGSVSPTTVASAIPNGIAPGSSTAGAGRGTYGTVADPRTDGIAMDRNLRAVPRDLPSGMIDNAIYRTGNVYSGRNVTAGAPMVDSYGREVNSRGSVNSLGDGQEAMARNLRAAAIYSSMAPQPAGDGGPQIAGIDGLRSTNERNARFDSEVLRGRLDEQIRLGGRQQRVAAINALQQMDEGRVRAGAEDRRTAAGERIAAGKNATDLAGERIKGEYGLRGAEVQAGATRRAGELRVQQDLMDREFGARLYSMAGGDRGKLADLYERAGMLDQASKIREGTGKLQGISAADDKLVQDRRAATRSLLAPMFSNKDSKSGYDDQALDAATIMLDERTGGRFASLPLAQQQAMVNDVRALTRIEGGQLKQGIGDRIMQGVGLQAPPPRREGALNRGGTVEVQGAVGVLPGQAAVGSVIYTDPKTGRTEVLKPGAATDRDLERLRGLR